MTFTVVWKTSAEWALAEIWTSADDRQAVTDSANAIDASLRSAPLEMGESRIARTRILAVLPLSVYYDVFDDDLRGRSLGTVARRTSLSTTADSARRSGRNCAAEQGDQRRRGLDSLEDSSAKAMRVKGF